MVLVHVNPFSFPVSNVWCRNTFKGGYMATRAINNKSGRATLGSLFFLGSETDDDDETGDGYLSVEYWDNSGDCSFAIRIGEKDDKGKLRAKIKLYCKDDKLKNIGLDDNPTLRTE